MISFNITVVVSILAIMFSAVVTKAFIPSIHHAVRVQRPLTSASSPALLQHFQRRFMMSSVGGGGGDETTLVSRCRDKIQQALEAADVQVTGAYDDPNGSHISIRVVSEKFEGKREVQRQQMVYKVLWEELQGPVHAVDAMICKTPKEASTA